MLLKNGRLFDPETGTNGGKFDIRIENGLVRKIAQKLMPEPGEKVLEAGNCFVIPGLVDLHAHFRVPGQEYKENIETGSRSAASGGITTALAMPNTQPAIDSPEIIKPLLEQIRKESCMEILVSSAMSIGRKGRESVNFKANREAGCSAFTDDGSSVQDREVLLKICREALITGSLLIEHPEIAFLAEGRPISYGILEKQLNLSGQPAESESLGILTLGILAGMTGCRVHFTHLSTRKSIEAVRFLKKTYPGLFTCDITPHHLILRDMDVTQPELNTNRKINPPLRPEKDRNYLEKAVLKGWVDAIATDHAPHSAEEKNLPLEKAAYGSLGFETLLPATFTRLVKKDGMPVLEWLALLTSNPARILNIDRGILAEGKRADITVFDPDAVYEVLENTIVSRSKNSAFIGMNFNGKVRYTISGGICRWK